MRVLVFIILSCWLVGPVWAHPFLYNVWRVQYEESGLTMWVTATLREVAEVQELKLRPGQFDLDELTAALQAHGAYVKEHLQVLADGTPLNLEIQDFHLISDGAEWDSTDPHELTDRNHAQYLLQTRLPNSNESMTLQFTHRTLEEHRYAPGIPWDIAYSFTIHDAQRKDLARGFIRTDLPYEFTIAKPDAVDGTESLHPASAPDPSPTALPLTTAWTAFLKHGLHHVLVGFDHLLFLAALALVTRRFIELMRLIAIFTLAHSITVTVSVLGWFTLPPWFIEPVIAASIVFVAVENVVAPERSRGLMRLGIAFGFGLIHGLGFAGGLSETLVDEPPRSLAGAILAFCVGVELGHLAVGIPLFAVLTAARRSQGKDAVSSATLPWVKWASVGVAAGGCFFLWAALREVI